MARWQPDARNRLMEAAMELFAEPGYDRTTVAEIAERAGLTKRTFFRHFADKREVLFSGSEQLEELIVGGVRAAPGDASPLDAVVAGLDATPTLFDVERRPFAVRRQAIVAAHPELQERELIKLARLSAAVAAALRDRGVAEPAATLAAETGLAIFHVAFQAWVAPDGGRELGPLIHQAAKDLRAIALA